MPRSDSDSDLGAYHCTKWEKTQVCISLALVITGTVLWFLGVQTTHAPLSGLSCLTEALNLPNGSVISCDRNSGMETQIDEVCGSALNNTGDCTSKTFQYQCQIALACFNRVLNHTLLMTMLGGVMLASGLCIMTRCYCEYKKATRQRQLNIRGEDFSRVVSSGFSQRVSKNSELVDSLLNPRTPAV